MSSPAPSGDAYMFTAVWPIDESERVPDAELIASARDVLRAVARRSGALVDPAAATLTIVPGSRVPGSRGAARVVRAVAPAKPMPRPVDPEPTRRQPRAAAAAPASTPPAGRRRRFRADPRHTSAYLHSDAARHDPGLDLLPR